MTTEAKHTPGPWADGIHHRQRDGGREFAYITANKVLVPVAAVPLGVEGYGFDEGCANAHLIAAAPDLLAALVAAKQEMWSDAKPAWALSDFKNWPIIQQIDAALEKADGKPRTDAALAKARS